MLKDGTMYKDLGRNHFDRRSSDQQKNRLVKRLADLGYAVESSHSRPRHKHVEPSHRYFRFFLSVFFSTPPNEFFQIQAYLSLVSTVRFAIFAIFITDYSSCWVLV
jgi:hypothetical protein